MDFSMKKAGYSSHISGMLKNHRKRNTVFLAAGMLAVFAAGYQIQRFLVPDSGKWAVIESDGKKVRRLDLDKETEVIIGDTGEETEDETGSDPAYNKVVVKDGTVSVTESNCPNQICVQTGSISNPGEVIACLPHKLIIYIDEERSAETQ